METDDKVGSVLVLGARAPAALEWVRAFVQSGVKVYAADSVMLPVTRGASGLHEYFLLPRPRADVNAWGRTIASIVSKHGIECIIPTCEETFYLSHQSPRFDGMCRLLTMPFNVMQSIHHKGEFAKATRGMPISAPETHLLDAPHSVKPFERESKDWVFKPAYSRFASQTLIRPPAKVLQRITPSVASPWVAQRWIQGRELCTYSIALNGLVTAHACYHPKYRVGLGSGIFFEPNDPPLIRQFVEQFVRSINYSGQIGFDFIEGEDEKTYVLECNPRATSGIHLFRLRQHQLIAALSAARTATPCAETRQFCIGLCMAIFGIPKYGLTKRFWRDWFSAKDVIVSRNDPFPLLAQLSGLFEIAGRALKSNMTLTAAATSDIEWDGDSLGEFVL